MREDHQVLLRAMLDAMRAHQAASAAERTAWKAYMEAQASFTGQFATSQHPLGPFVVGTMLIEHEPNFDDTWSPKDNVFSYSEVIRCPTSE